MTRPGSLPSRDLLFHERLIPTSPSRCGKFYSDQSPAAESKSERDEFAAGKKTDGPKWQAIRREVFRSLLELSKRSFAEGKSGDDVLEILMVACDTRPSGSANSLTFQGVLIMSSRSPICRSVSSMLEASDQRAAEPPWRAHHDEHNDAGQPIHSP